MAMRDRARPPETPAPLAPLLIVTRMGRDYRPGPRQRIEQVAREGSGKKFGAAALELGFQSPLWGHVP